MAPLWRCRQTRTWARCSTSEPRRESAGIKPMFVWMYGHGWLHVYGYMDNWIFVLCGWYRLCMCMRTRVHVCTYVLMMVCAPYGRGHLHTYKHMFGVNLRTRTYILIYIYICCCVCECVYFNGSVPECVLSLIRMAYTHFPPLRNHRQHAKTYTCLLYTYIVYVAMYIEMGVYIKYETLMHTTLIHGIGPSHRSNQ